MPEGPEIRRAADRIAAALVDRTATDIFFAFEHLQPFREILVGATVTAIETRGKALLTRFDKPYSIYSHNQLYGVWYVRAPGTLPDTKRQLRLAIHNRNKSALLYSASDIEVLHDSELPYHPFLSRIGPDALDSKVTPEEIAERLTEKAFMRRRLAGLLLDQGFVSGLGNYLRSEILFVSRLHPQQRPIDLSDTDRDRLARAILDVTRQSYATGGITNDPAIAASLKAEGWKRWQYRHWVFSRAGEPCFVCGTRIEKSAIAGRRAYICPKCQPLR
ncbi:MAG: endonuclease VIII [Geitlerinemataceae cyanobacterium]